MGWVTTGVAIIGFSSAPKTAADCAIVRYGSSTLQMSEEQLMAFLTAVKADAVRQEKLKAASDADAVVSIAKTAGFAISADDLTKAQAEVSEDDLEGVAGGGVVHIDVDTVITCFN